MSEHIEAVRELINEPIGNGMFISGYLIATNKVLPCKASFRALPGVS